MKRIIIFILFLTVSVSAQNKSKSLATLIEENSKFNQTTQCDISYNKFDNQTTITSNSFFAKSNGGVITMNIYASFEGNELKESIKQYIVTVLTPNRLIRYDLVYFSDEKRKDVMPLSADVDPMIYQKRRVFPYFYIFFPKELEAFASSDSVEFQIGGYKSSTNKMISESIKNILILGTVNK